MSVTTVCRDIDELNKVAQNAILLFFQECHKAGVAIFVTETYRSQARQNYLYEQGRTRSGSIVTWTKNSRHTGRMAWDIAAAQVNGNTDIYNLAIIKKAGAIATKLGITWGGTWKDNIDYPHFEVTSSWKMPAGYKMDGVVSIPTKSTGVISIKNTVSELPKVSVTVPENKVEEEIKVSSNQITVKDITSSTLRTSVVNMLKRALASGAINNKEWVDAAEKGTLSAIDLLALFIHINKGFDLSGAKYPAISKVIADKIEDGLNDEVITNKEWLDLARAGNLSAVDAIGLLEIINHGRREE